MTHSRVTPAGLAMGKSPASEALHAAVCQAVALLNRAPEVARCAEGREAHTILRQALADYADAYMDQPAPEAEREAERERLRGYFRDALADTGITWPGEVDILYDKCFGAPYVPDEAA